MKVAPSNYSSAINSLWAKTAQSAPETLSLHNETKHADVVIIGAGFTGLRAAIELANKGRNVIVIEAGSVGWGASGRSGGQVNPIMRLTSERIAQEFGSTAATRLIKATINSADEVFDLIKQHNINCDAVQKGWLQVAHCQSAAKSLEQLAHDWESYGANIRVLGADEVCAQSGSTLYGAGLFHPQAGHLQPLSYVRGLAKTALSKGVQIFTHSAASSIKRAENQWEIQVGAAVLKSEYVLICTNAYSSGLCKEIDNSYLPFTPIQLATEVLSPSLYEEILPNDQTIADTRRLIFYGRKTADGRLVFGGLGKSIYSQKDYARIKNEAVRIFPQLKGVEWDYSWGGNIAMTENSLPHIHDVAPGLLAAIGCNGRGVAMGTVMGRVLAEYVVEGAKELDVPVSAIKPIRLKSLKSAVIPYGLPILGLLDSLDK